MKPVTLRTVALTSTAGVVAPPVSATADVALRRLQAFPHAPWSRARFEVRDAGGAALHTGEVTADADGLYTAPGMEIASAGTTLILSALDDALLADGFEAELAVVQ